MVQKSGDHQLSLGESTIIYKFFFSIPDGAGFRPSTAALNSIPLEVWRFLNLETTRLSGAFAVSFREGNYTKTRAGDLNSHWVPVVGEDVIFHQARSVGVYIP